MEVSYQVWITLDAPSASSDVGRVAAAIGLCLAEEAAHDLVINKLEVEREDES